MIRRVVALFTIAMWSSTAIAGHTMVLPVDGDANAALRKQIDGVILGLARSTGEDITTGTTTFDESAAAVGCDPHVPSCADTVIATLGVDEIIYGTAATSSGQTAIVVTRVAKARPRQEQTLALAAGASADTLEPTLRPLFGGATPEPVNLAPAAPSAPTDTLFSTRERKLGFAFVASGALVFIIGLALWSSESSTQGQIDNAPINSPTDVKNLLALEDRASTYAWEGNILVVLGLAAAGVGTYYLVKGHPVHATVAPTATGAAVMLGGRW